MNRSQLVRALASTAVACGTLPAGAFAANFHGFDPATFDGTMLPPAQLKAMVAEAQKKTPPKDGKTYTFGFANLQRDVAFCILTEKGLQANADAAGIKLVVADNRLDGSTALTNAQSFVRQHVDFVIEFQTDVNFGPKISKTFKDAGIDVIAIDIPMVDTTFFGVNNPRSGFMTGSYLGAAAVHQFSASKVHDGYFVDGALPQSGVIPALRTRGQVAGFNAMVPGFPADHIVQIDTKNTLQESYTQMTNVLGRIPRGVPIMVTAINDQSAIGMLRAVKAAGRSDDLIVVGNGADEAQALVTEDRLVASTGSFPERYGNYLIPMALDELAGHSLPAAVLVHHVMVTKANICKFNPSFPCKGSDAFTYVFPQVAFEKYLASLKTDPTLTGYTSLLPKS
jgi:ribose transport system substrate-binding protein